MDKPKYCPIINIGRTEFATKCVRGECEWWDEENQKCYPILQSLWFGRIAHVLDAMLGQMKTMR